MSSHTCHASNAVACSHACMQTYMRVHARAGSSSACATRSRAASPAARRRCTAATCSWGCWARAASAKCTGCAWRAQKQGQGAPPWATRCVAPCLPGTAAQPPPAPPHPPTGQTHTEPLLSQNSAQPSSDKPAPLPRLLTWGGCRRSPSRSTSSTARGRRPKRPRTCATPCGSTQSTRRSGVCVCVCGCVCARVKLFSCLLGTEMLATCSL